MFSSYCKQALYLNAIIDVLMDLFRQHFGETEVEVEKGKKEERATGGLKNMTMSKFLHLYQTEDIYQVFDITPDMKSLLINFYFCL